MTTIHRQRRRATHYETLEMKCCLSSVTFVPQPVIRKWSGNDQGGYEHIQAVDLDSDQDLDLLVTTSQGNSWYRNNGEGDFKYVTELPWYSSWYPSANAQSIAPGDINGDGHLDIAFIAYNGIFWFENTNGLGDFSPKVPEAIVEMDSQLFERSWIGTLDIDTDGDVDIVAVEAADRNPPYSDPGAIVWYENEDGRGSFGDRRLITDEIGSSYGTFTSVVFADVDGDGDSDIVADNTCRWLEPVVTPRVTWYEHLDGQGTFGPPHVVDTERGATYSTDVADLDNDGDLDLLSATSAPLWGAVNVAAYTNQNAVGDFSAAQVVAVLGEDVVHNASMGPSITTADLDSDGDPDAIVAEYLNGKFTWYENINADRLFGDAQVVAASDTTAIDVVAGDFNGDGGIDLAAAFRDQIVWFENRVIGDANHDRVFDSGDLVRVFAAGGYEDDIIGNATFDIGDWNQDGDFDSNDLIFASQAGTYVSSGMPTLGEIAAAVDRMFDTEAEVNKDVVRSN
ncbi:MAG: VCBS repeat-containing protein [Planctomycetales bacterium]|nr:VCBS repeat-containing protein [Planctomycetales bacterium]